MPLDFPRIGTGILVFNEKREFLFGKRRGKHAPGVYCLPGGWLEFGEKLNDCATREVLEETGLRIDRIRLLTVIENFFPEENKHTVSLIFAGRALDPENLENKEPEKSEGFRWYADWKTLPSPTFSNYHDYISLKDIEDYLDFALSSK